MAKRLALGNNPALTEKLGWITDTSKTKKAALAPAVSPIPPEKANKQFSSLAVKHIDRIAVKRPGTSSPAVKPNKSIPQAKAHTKAKEGKPQKAIKPAPVKTPAQPKVKDINKVHITMMIDKDVWETIKTNSIKAGITMSDYAIRELSSKADKHIDSLALKQFSSSAGMQDMTPLSLYPPKELLTDIKLRAHKLRVPYSKLIEGLLRG